MRESRLSSFGSLAALIVAVLLFCLGALLLASSLSGGTEVLASSSVGYASHADKGMPGDGNAPTTSYVAVPVEEAENADREPVNAHLLTALFFLAGFLGSILVLLEGRLLWNGYAVSFAGCLPSPPLQHSRRMCPAPLLAVFRL